jgi:Protein of unknown function (DUF1579)
MKTQISLAVMMVLGGTAFAQMAPKPADPKKADPAAKAPEPKKAPDTMAKADPVKAGEPAKKPEMMKAPAEVADMAKMMAGNWKCTGKGAMDPTNPTAMTDMKGTYKATVDLDKFWVRGEYTAIAGPIKMRGVEYVTFDPGMKKWFRVSVDSTGGHEMHSATGLPAGAKEGKIVWEGDARMMGMMMKSRVTEDITAKEVKLMGEMSMDGKKWMQGFEMSCKK